MESRRHFRHALAAVAACCGLLGLAGCSARTDVGTTGAAPAERRAPVGDGRGGMVRDGRGHGRADSSVGWNRERLSAPAVLDLANVDAGSLEPLATGLSLPAGRYRQLHLVIADSGDRLLDEARALGLEFNAQIDVQGETDRSRGRRSSCRCRAPGSRFRSTSRSRTPTGPATARRSRASR